jgi:hypothetical protein
MRLLTHPDPLVDIIDPFAPVEFRMFVTVFQAQSLTKATQYLAISTKPRTIRAHPAIRPALAGCTSKLSHPK